MILKHATQTRALRASPEDEVQAPSYWARRLHWLVAAGDALALSVVLRPLGRTGPEGASYVALALLALALRGFYRPQIAPRVWEHLPRLLAALSIPLIPIGAIQSGSPRFHAVLRALPLAVLLVVVGRIVSLGVLRVARRRRLIVEPTLIIGAGTLGVQTARTLQAHPEYGLRPIGFLDSRHDARLPLPILGNVADLKLVIDIFAVRRVIVAFGMTREPDMVRVLRACDETDVEVHVVPRFFELGVAPVGNDIEYVWGIPLLRLHRAALRSPLWRVKRPLDVVVAAALLVMTAPLFGIIGVCIRLTDRGPVFFRQTRVGQRGRLITIFKFRTLPMSDDSDHVWSVDGHAGMTRIGRFLRATSLDELPQLLNVLRGDMSLVGPRPERPTFVDKFAASYPHYRDRHRVPVGMTGWAQVNGLRGDTSIDERARFDNYYIEHWGLWRDFTILLCSILPVLCLSGRPVSGRSRIVNLPETEPHPLNATEATTPASATGTESFRSADPLFRTPGTKVAQDTPH